MCQGLMRLRKMPPLQRLQKVDQVLYLLGGQTYLETLVVEIHDLRKIGRYTVVEVRRPCRKTSQDETLATSNITALSRNQRLPGVGRVKRLPGKLALVAHQLKHGKRWRLQLL